MTAHDDVANAVAPYTKDRKQAITIANAVIDALDKHGWLTTDNDHLARMRALLERNSSLALDPDTPARDVAALTNRCQALSKDVATLEERVRQEGRGKRGKPDTGKASGSFDPGQI